MKTLLFVAPHIGYGGAEKNFIGIANYAANNGYRVFLLTEEGQENVRQIDPAIIQMTAKLDPDARLAKKYFQAITAVKKALKESHADAVISFVELWRSACVIATRGTQTKCIVSERVDPYTRSGRFNKVIFSIFSMADGFVFQTEQARDFFSNKVRKRGVVIPNPVFPEDCLQEYTGKKKNIVVSIARLDLKQKRQDLIINAFKLIYSKYPDLELYLYGDGKDRESIEKQIADLGLEGRVFLKGVTHDVYQSLGEAEMMVLASDYEGIPNAIIESMCVGVPVVSTKCSPGGAEFLIEDGKNGLLVDRGDYHGLAKAMERLLDDPTLNRTIAMEGLKIKNRLSCDIILPRWTVYIDNICALKKQ